MHFALYDDKKRVTAIMERANVNSPLGILKAATREALDAAITAGGYALFTNPRQKMAWDFAQASPELRSKWGILFAPIVALNMAGDYRATRIAITALPAVTEEETALKATLLSRLP